MREGDRMEWGNMGDTRPVPLSSRSRGPQRPTHAWLCMTQTMVSSLCHRDSYVITIIIIGGRASDAVVGPLSVPALLVALGRLLPAGR